MANNFHMPPTGFGPGSQDNEGEINYMPLPSGMRTYSTHIPDIDDPQSVEAALLLLNDIANACDETANDGKNRDFDISDLNQHSRKLLAETLGQGEVSAKIRGVPAIAAQESVFAGVWVLSGNGVERVEVGSMPNIAYKRANIPHRPAIGVLAQKNEGVLNAPPILSELIAKSQEYHENAPTHVVNMTLLPHTEEDLEWLGEALGEGAVTILSRGYGNCRITALAQPHVWRVQFYNSMDTLILDTFEVTPMPEVALAAKEDIIDSAERIREVIEAIK